MQGVLLGLLGENTRIREEFLDIYLLADAEIFGGM